MNTSQYITSINIKNHDSKYGICAIALFIGSDKSPSKWMKLCQDITNITNEHEDTQHFELDALSSSDYFVWRQRNDLNLIKLKILKNHGDKDWNIFSQFEVFGVAYDMNKNNQLNKLKL
eukprot:437037_1